MKNFFEAIERFDVVAVRFLNLECSHIVSDYLMIFFTNLGYGHILFFAMAITLYFYSKENFWRNLLVGFIALFLSGVIVQIMKYFINRHRPMAEIDGLRIIIERLSWKSFPSGHSASAFAAAVFLANRVKKYWLAFYSVAFFVALSRVYLAVHYPSDIIAGSIIGVIVSLCVLKIEKTFMPQKTT